MGLPRNGYQRSSASEWVLLHSSYRPVGALVWKATYCCVGGARVPLRFAVYPSCIKSVIQAIEQFVFKLGSWAFMALVAQYGTATYAAYGIGVQILSVSFVVGFGFSIAGATLFEVGQYLGAGDPEAS